MMILLISYACISIMIQLLSYIYIYSSSQMDYEPPFVETYKTLLQKHNNNDSSFSMVEVENCDLPSIDLERLNNNNLEEDDDSIMEEISKAAMEWGFFEVVNHGVSEEVLESIKFEQMKLFYQPFVNKSSSSLSSDTNKIYRWGNPSATNLKQIIWSEAFHFPLADISTMNNHNHKTLRSSIEAFATALFPLAERLAEILAFKLNMKSEYFRENCLPECSIIRLNRYPPCPISSKVYGLLPHSDTSFLTIIHQHQFVGGLQLMKDGKWVGVKPNPRALVVNIGDLFQALSNGVYKSIKHRVVVAEKVERFSIAFFYCPTEEAVIQGHNNNNNNNTAASPSMYKKFTLKEYRDQNYKDVKQTGDKVGLSSFLL